MSARLVGASVAARLIGVPVQLVVEDIQSGLAGRNYLAFSGGQLEVIGWCVEEWELEPSRVEMHRKRLAGGSSGTPDARP